MNLRDMLLDPQNGALVRQLATQLGIDEGQARSAAEAVLPTLARGLQRNASSGAGLESLLGALKSGSHQQYYDHPEELGRRETIADGNAILGHVFGSKDVSRNVAGHASQQTGIQASILKQMLPMLAAAAMGALAKQSSGGGILGRLSPGAAAPPAARASAPPASGFELLSGFLDADGDGSVADDLIGLAKRFF